MSHDEDMESIGLGQQCGHIVATQVAGQIFKEPCPVPVIQHGMHCMKHGGGEMVKQEKVALERTVLQQRRELEEKVLPLATKRILEVLNNEEAKDADIVNIWKTVMDRIGLAAVQGVIVEGSIQVEAPLDILRKMLEGNVIDGEVVEPEEI